MSYEHLASCYDELMYDVPAGEWFEYLMTLCDQPRRVLEYACGTGRLTEHFLKAGIEIVALDISEEMLNVALRKLRPLGGKLQLVQSDMSGFRLEHCVEVALCACDGVNYVTEGDKLTSFFQSALHNLCAGGLFLFDISSSYKLEHVIGNNLFYDDEDETTLFWQNEFDSGTRLSTMNLTLFQSKGDLYERFDEVHIQRAWSVEEIKEALRYAGFVEIHAFDFGTMMPRSPHSERIQFSARKPRNKATHGQYLKGAAI